MDSNPIVQPEQNTASKYLAFQNLQYALSKHIRDPENNHFQPLKSPGVVSLPIEERRLEAYSSLFYNNLFDFFSNLFPVLKSIVGDERWHEITREYLQKHSSKTPLFHELGQEFLSFCQSEFTPLDSDPAYLLELAHYEWVELAVGIDEAEGPLNPIGLTLDWQQIYELSPVAWPLAYEWPVHRIDVDSMNLDKPDWVTTLLVYRDDDDAVQFMALSPILYELLNAIMNAEDKTLWVVLSEMAEQMGEPVESLQGFSEQVLEALLAQNILSPLS